MKPTDFAKTLSRYLSEYLPGQRNVSPNTMKSYRETFRLLLRYGKGCGLSIERLCLRHIDEPFIVGFLSWLEHERNSSIATRNQRLACIHGFFRYVQIENPDAIASYQRILSIPMKKAPVPTVNHLTPDALKLILDQPDLTRPCGRRDVTLLSVLYDTGARVQELADLRVRDVRLDQPPIVTLTGKGRKTRQVPLMSATESLLRHYMTEARLLQNGMQDHPLFFNRRHGNLTQKGISFVLDKYVSRARAKSSIVPDKVTPHSLRHTKVRIGVPFTILCHGRSGKRTPDMLQGSVATSPWPESIGYLPERGFKEWLNDLFDGTLYHTVLYGCYAQGPELPRLAGLGY